jgi:hypothetical protein
MKTNQANKILKVLERLNAEAELIGKILLQHNAKPVAVPIRVNNRFNPRN